MESGLLIIIEPGLEHGTEPERAKEQVFTYNLLREEMWFTHWVKSCRLGTNQCLKISSI